MKLKAFLTLALLLAFSAPLATAQDNAACNLVGLFDGWAASSPSGAANGAVFGKVVNLSGQSDTLVSVSGDVAEAIEIHETTMADGGVMKMRPVEGGLQVGANGYAELKPGGFHIMLINLRQPLEVGGSVDLTLHFEHAGDFAVTVPIRDRAEMMESNGMAMPSATMDMSGMAMPSATMDMSGMAMDAAATPESSMTMPMATEPVWPEACRGIHVVDPWAKPSIPGAPNSAAYALLLNLTGADETLLGVETTAAMAEIHSMTMGDNNVMVMRPVEGGLVIPAGGTALLQPGGLHVMLMSLKSDLQVGGTLDLTLKFATAGDVPVSVPIREPADDSGGMAGM